MAKVSKKYSLVFPVTWSIVFGVLTVASTIFFIINLRAANDYNNPKSVTYDSSGLGSTVSTFMGFICEAAMVLFGLITLILVLVIFLRIIHNKRVP